MKIIILILLSIYLTDAKEDEKLGNDFFNIDLLNIGGGSFYNGEVDVLSLSYRSSFPGIGIKINAVEYNIVKKSSLYTSFVVPYLLIPLRANKNSINSSIIDGEVEFYLGGQLLNSVDGFDKNDKIYYLNGGISITKLFDIFDLTSLSLKIGYKSLFNDKISSKSQFNNTAYGFLVLNTHLFKISKSSHSSVKNQIKNMSIKTSLSEQFYNRYFIIDGSRLESISSTVFDLSLMRKMNDKLSFFINYSNFGSVSEDNILYKLEAKSNSLSFGIDYKIINFKNRFSLPVSSSIGLLILNDANYLTKDIEYNMLMTISPLMKLNIEPTYTIDFNNFDLSFFVRSQINGSVMLRENIYNDNISYRILGYSIGGGLKIEF